MFFGINTFLWTDRFHEDDLPLLARIADLGADAVEFACFDFDGFPLSAVERELAGLGLRATICSAPPAHERSAIHPDATARRAALDYLRQAVAAAATLRAPVLAGPLYAPVGFFSGARVTEDELRCAAEVFRALGPDLERTGVALALEPINRFETYVLNTAAEGLSFCERVGHPQVGLMLDTAHMAVEEKDPVDSVRTAGSWLKHLQLPETDRGTPGSGRLIDWTGLFATLREVGYAGGCAIESFAFSDPRIAAKTHIWRDLAPSAETLARDGLRFLKHAWNDSGAVR